MQIFNEKVFPHESIKGNPVTRPETLDSRVQNIVMTCLPLKRENDTTFVGGPLA